MFGGVHEPFDSKYNNRVFGQYNSLCLTLLCHFQQLRTQALAALHSGLLYNQGVPVARVSKWLGMEVHFHASIPEDVDFV